MKLLVAVDVTATVLQHDGTCKHYDLHEEFGTLEGARSYVELIQHHAMNNSVMKLCHVVVWGLYSHMTYGSWTLFGYFSGMYHEWDAIHSGWFFD